MEFVSNAYLQKYVNISLYLKTKFLVKLLDYKEAVRYTNLLYILTSVFVLRTPNAGRNSQFQHFLC